MSPEQLHSEISQMLAKLDTDNLLFVYEFLKEYLDLDRVE